MSPLVSAVTVDLDDTLFAQDDWLRGAWDAVAGAGGRLGLDARTLHEALLRAAAGGSDRGGIIDRALADIGAPAGHVAVLVAAFAAHRPPVLLPYPGAREALERLSDALPVVCVTDGMGDVQRAKLAALGVRDMLTGVVVSDELGGRHLRKPHVAPFRAALDLLGVPADQVIHIGDRLEKDVAGAGAAGMRCIRVTTGEYGHLRPEGRPPWRTVPTFAAAAELALASGTARESARL